VDNSPILCGKEQTLSLWITAGHKGSCLQPADCSTSVTASASCGLLLGGIESSKPRSSGSLDFTNPQSSILLGEI
jgi:hypothetical protein